MNERYNNDIYDDYMEPLSNIRKEYQEFSLQSKKYIENKRYKWNKGFVGGVPILGYEDTVYVDSQDTHTLIVGSTGSKKTRLIVMPTVRLLGWGNESMIISDPKAEIYHRTAGELEAQGYRVVVLNFREPDVGDTWNPLHIPYTFYKDGNIDRACEMVNDIAKNIIAASLNSTDPFWMDSAADLFFGLVLTLFKLCKEGAQSEMAVNISNVIKLRHQLFDNSMPAETPIWNCVRDDEVIAPALSGIVMTAKDTRGGILSTFDQKVRFFVYQPNLMNMLANNSIMVNKISEEKTAVYLIMPDEKTTYHTLISLFVKQSYEYLIYSAQQNQKAQLKIRLNYILDEFSSLPTIKDFPSMITAARSRNIRFHLVMQSKHQLRQRYGDETETIQANCGNLIFLTSREVPLLEELSKLCGTIEKGTIPLVSIFALQHLDKESGQALILSGRKCPFYAELPDIDEYDNRKYNVRRGYRNALRNDRVDILGNKVAKQIMGEHQEELVFHKISNGMYTEFMDDEDILNGSAREIMGRDSSLEYQENEDAGFEAYEKGDYAKAKEHFIQAVKCWPYKDMACESENNLAYMLRRREIEDIEIDGVFYTVPEILEKGVDAGEAFFLVNMALYFCNIDYVYDISKGNVFIRRIEKEESEQIKKWWEKVAQNGETEGYIVLFWLFVYRLIEESSIGDEKEIAGILKDRFGIDTSYYYDRYFQVIDTE